MIFDIILGSIMICIIVITVVVIVFKIIVHECKRNHYKVNYLKYLKHLGEIYKNNDSLE